jgi:antitoxin YefM
MGARISSFARETAMREMSVNQFRSRLRAAVEGVLHDHDPLRVTRRGGGDFVVVGAEDWERERETLYVLENRSLMQQIARSLATREAGTGYRPSAEELDEIDRL